MIEHTVDVPRAGLSICQPRDGFRYGAEAFWVVGLALEGDCPVRAADLGTGSGIMAWLLAAEGVDVWAVDVRPEWQALWEKTSGLTRVSGRVALVCGDVHTARPPHPVDLVVCNPPFFRVGSGPSPGDPWKAAARFECHGTIATFVEAAVDMLSEDGRAVFVVPCDREDDITGAVSAPWRVVQKWYVGKRRVLVTVSRAIEPLRVHAVDEQAPRVVSWYRRASGVTHDVAGESAHEP